jgi:hypothetical protein
MRKYAFRTIIGVLLLTGINRPVQLPAGEPFFHRIDISLHGGFLLPHDKSMQHLSKGHFLMQQIILSGQTRGVRPWHSIYNYPELGVGFLFSNLAYPEVLGFAYSVLPMIGFELFNSNNFYLFSRYGVGLAWLSKTYNKENNFTNIGIGQNLNIAIHASLEMRFKIMPQWFLFSGLSLTHFSNGRVKVPNKGLNIPSARLGINYNLQPERQKFATTYKNGPQRKPELVMVAAGGISSHYPPGSKPLGRFSFNTTGNIPLNKKNRIGIGYDLFLAEALIREDWEIVKEGYFIMQGVSIGFQQDYSRVAFILHKGIYFQDQNNLKDKIFYHRTGFRINPYGDIILNITLKSHYFRAETIEWGLGYKL